MKWMRERDLLIAQTLAFVQSVTGKLPETDATTVTSAAETTAATPPSAAAHPVATSESIHTAPPLAEVRSATVEIAPRRIEQALPIPAPVELLLPVEEAQPVVAQDEPKPAPVIDVFSPPDLRVDFQTEIRARVASFRAHQERFSREREAYCSTTMAKVHASIREIGPPANAGD
ncbi:MAG: hypothetical protein ABW175_12675 [Bradyrhizobium sp.]